MEIFIDALAFWFAAACVYGVYQLSGELYKDIRAKYIVWMWKRRKWP